VPWAKRASAHRFSRIAPPLTGRTLSASATRRGLHETHPRSLLSPPCRSASVLAMPKEKNAKVTLVSPQLPTSPARAHVCSSNMALAGYYSAWPTRIPNPPYLRDRFFEGATESGQRRTVTTYSRKSFSELPGDRHGFRRRRARRTGQASSRVRRGHDRRT